MSELENVLRQTRRYEEESEFLLHQLEGIEQASTPHFAQLDLATQEAKRVRRELTILLRALARHRDTLQSNGGHKE